MEGNSFHLFAFLSRTDQRLFGDPMVELGKGRNLLGIYCCVPGYLKSSGLTQETFIISVSVGREFRSIFRVVLA